MGLKWLRQQRQQKGVTLVELIIAISIVSIALAALMQSWSYNISSSADPLLQRKSLNLAQMYVDEILSKRFDENSPLGGGTIISASINCPTGSGLDAGESGRDDFDDVDDYHGVVDAPPLDINGVTMASYGSYQVAINISCISGQFAIASANHIKLIEVAVTSPAAANSFTLSVYKANF
ncbi:MAG: prepilin-type N-terminal cleavage/methylation domain-containing protein [Pseudomonadales bacterium]|nr:prepilin-type N-terminal cleavage/methylation domain-containing protein [Pseudomonadales bacterium]